MLGNINSETMRATNLQVIFDYIRRNEPASGGILQNSAD